MRVDGPLARGLWPPDGGRLCTRVVSPQGETTHYILCVAPLLHPLLSLTHWIFRSLMLPYKSSSHSAKCVRCASLRSGGDGFYTSAPIPVISTEAKRSGEISLHHGTGSIGAGDLSTLSIMEAVLVCFPYRHAAPLEMTVAASAPPVMFIKKGRGSAAGCVEGLHPTGKTAHYILCVAPLLHPLLSLTHWIFRSLMLPYKSSSHSAKCVRCASLLFRGRGERVLCSKKHKKRTPEGVLFFHSH